MCVANHDFVNDPVFMKTQDGHKVRHSSIGLSEYSGFISLLLFSSHQKNIQSIIGPYS